MRRWRCKYSSIPKGYYTIKHTHASVIALSPRVLRIRSSHGLQQQRTTMRLNTKPTCRPRLRLRKRQHNHPTAHQVPPHRLHPPQTRSRVPTVFSLRLQPHVPHGPRPNHKLGQALVVIPMLLGAPNARDRRKSVWHVRSDDARSQGNQKRWQTSGPRRGLPRRALLPHPLLLV